MHDKLSEILDIEPIPRETTDVIVSQSIPVSNTQTASEDATFARDNIRQLIATSVPTLENLIRIANDSQHPRAYEVVTQLVKTISDLNKDLMDVHKKEADISKSSAPSESAGIHVNNAVFVGTTKELRDKLKQS